MFSFTDNLNNSNCTMNLDLEKCLYVQICPSHKFSFYLKFDKIEYYFRAANLNERNEWLIKLKLVIINLKIIEEREEPELKNLQVVC